MAMLSSVACAIPGIMATRTMPSARQRFATMMSLLLMTCSARMPVYTLLIGMLIASDSKVWIFNAQGAVLFGLYLLGAISTMTVAKIISVFLCAPRPMMPFTMEMPPYRVPSWKLMLVEIWSPVKGFIRKAGTIILFATVVLWALLNLPMRSDADLVSAGIDPTDSTAVSTYTMNNSIAASLGQRRRTGLRSARLRLEDQCGGVVVAGRTRDVRRDAGPDVGGRGSLRTRP